MGSDDSDEVAFGAGRVYFYLSDIAGGHFTSRIGVVLYLRVFVCCLIEIFIDDDRKQIIFQQNVALNVSFIEQIKIHFFISNISKIVDASYLDGVGQSLG